MLEKNLCLPLLVVRTFFFGDQNLQSNIYTFTCGEPFCYGDRFDSIVVLL